MIEQGEAELSVCLTATEARIAELGGVHFARVLAGTDEHTFALALVEQVGVIERAIVDAGFGAEQASFAAEHFATAAREARWEHVAGKGNAVGLDRA